MQTYAESAWWRHYSLITEDWLDLGAARDPDVLISRIREKLAQDLKYGPDKTQNAAVTHCVESAIENWRAHIESCAQTAATEGHIRGCVPVAVDLAIQALARELREKLDEVTAPAYRASLDGVR